MARPTVCEPNRSLIVKVAGGVSVVAWSLGCGLVS